ncbi:hypothetical protein QLX67_06875 [Balneolaceae bacterium ANBcel3]|nr:hypothetical protein [Balneolaceae bacterium ANBcel3]
MYNRIQKNTTSMAYNTLFYVSFFSYVLLILLFLMLADGAFNTANGQQMVIDDVEVTDYRGFSLETWYGQEESWVILLFSPLKGLELAPALMYTDDDVFGNIEAKYMFRAPGGNGPGIGLVSGAIWAPFIGFYTYVPVTFTLPEERAVINVNVGYEWEEATSGHAATWGARVDVPVLSLMTLLGEVFGSNGDTPDFQVGVRWTIVPDLLEMDTTYGNHFGKEHSGLGFAVGLAWTPSFRW